MGSRAWINIAHDSLLPDHQGAGRADTHYLMASAKRRVLAIGNGCVARASTFARRISATAFAAASPVRVIDDQVGACPCGHDGNRLSSCRICRGRRSLLPNQKPWQPTDREPTHAQQSRSATRGADIFTILQIRTKAEIPLKAARSEQRLGKAGVPMAGWRGSSSNLNPLLSVPARVRARRCGMFAACLLVGLGGGCARNRRGPVRAPIRPPTWALDLNPEFGVLDG
jgi:hypothetical protein